MNQGLHSPQKVLNISRAQSGVPFHDFSWGTGEVTEEEKRRAEAGAAARSTFGAKRDACKKGKSCGSACIFYRKDCILELPVTVQTSVRAARAYIQRLATSGQISPEDAESTFLRTTGLGSKFLSPDADLKNPAMRGKLDAALKEARPKERYERMREEIKNIRRESSSEAEARDKVKHAVGLALTQAHGVRKGSVDAITEEDQAALRSPKQQERFRQLQTIYDNQKSGVYKTNQEFNDALEKSLSWYYKRDVSPAEVRLFLSSLPPDVSKALLAKGDIAKGVGINGKEIPYWGTATPGRNNATIPRPANATPEQNKEFDAMGKLGNQHQIAKIFLDSNGLDIYTRRPLQLTGADLEHTVPENVAGSGRANSSANRTLTSSAINQNKGNRSFSESLYADSGSSIYGRTGTSPKRQLLNDIESGTKSAAQALAAAGSLPKDALDAKGWKELNSGIITRLAQVKDGGTTSKVSQAVNIGQTGGGKNNTQGWYLFGGKEGSGWDAKLSADLGSKVASKLSQWADEGSSGTVKIANLTRQLLTVQRQALSINDDPWGGGTIRQIGFKQDTEAKRHVENRIKGVMEENLPIINGLLDQ